MYSSGRRGMGSQYDNWAHNIDVASSPDKTSFYDMTDRVSKKEPEIHHGSAPLRAVSPVLSPRVISDTATLPPIPKPDTLSPSLVNADKLLLNDVKIAAIIKETIRDEIKNLLSWLTETKLREIVREEVTKIAQGSHNQSQNTSMTNGAHYNMSTPPSHLSSLNPNVKK
ncbi:MAG: hypothetical protein Solumvirus1_38 [Solumvirus sp.]|uniref:Uncharacterized protein n=1 Tax=Solumvirus sp. TaxID=2487773 RepID=A0A3G5AJM3_9VIRU|nr:MAG: hypothetical protein Solumvirus1_38 [Solumvirus sp.]